MKKHHGIAVMASAALLAWGSAAWSITSTATLSPSATVSSQCKNLAVGALAFGSYDVSSNTDLTASQTINVACTAGTAITLSLSSGATSGATTSARLLSDGAGHTMGYNLYSNATLTTVWDDGSNKVSGTGQGLAINLSFTVYGKIPPGQANAIPGNYSDTVTVTLSY